MLLTWQHLSLQDFAIPSIIVKYSARRNMIVCAQ
jgi:hypothetical protein